MFDSGTWGTAALTGCSRKNYFGNHITACLADLSAVLSTVALAKVEALAEDRRAKVDEPFRGCFAHFVSEGEAPHKGAPYEVVH